MRDYFEAEMRLLHESARAFAAAHPEQARHLDLEGLKDRDPCVERLLEGMAYLTAQLRCRIDDDIPEIAETLLDQLWPRMLRPYPSATILEFRPLPGQLQRPRTIAAHTEVRSRAVPAASASGEPLPLCCRFRTTEEVCVRPLRVDSLEVGEATGGGALLSLGLQVEAGEAGAIAPDRLRLFLHADPALALWLRHQLCGRLLRVEVDAEGLERLRLGGAECLEPAGLDWDGPVLPGAGEAGDGGVPGLGLLHDYFCFRDRFLFVDLLGLDRVAWPPGCRRFRIHLRVADVPPPDHRLKPENIRLHCAPAVNLFRTETEPVRLDQRRVAYPLVADAAAPDAVQVYGVEEVTGSVAPGSASTGAGVRRYHPMHSFRQGPAAAGHYHCHRRWQGARQETWISVDNGDQRAETLSCVVTAHDGDLPRRHLRAGDLTDPGPGFPSTIRVTNLTRPSVMRRPPDRDRYRWDLVAHLGFNVGSLSRPGALRRLLALYDWSGDEQNRRRLEALQEVELGPRERVRRGALSRGLEFRLTVQERHFRDRADLHLFGDVLHRFLAMHAAINCFVETRLVCQPGQETLSWEPLPGAGCLL